MFDKPYETLLDTIYEAVVLPQKWIEVCDRLARLENGVGALLLPDVTELRRFGLPHSDALNESVEVYQRDGWYFQDERYHGRATHGLARVVFDQDIMTAEQMASSPFYNDFLRPCGLRWFAGISISVGGKPWTASIQRSNKQGPFEESDRRRLELLASHLSRAATTAAALHYVQAEGAVEAFERMSIGAVVIDDGGRAILINKIAYALMGDGLQIRQSRLEATNTIDAAALNAMVHACASLSNVAQLSPPQIVAVRRPSGKNAYQLSACPLSKRSVDIFGDARALILIVDPAQRRRPTTEVLRTQFGLTVSEAKLAKILAEGHSLEGAANLVCITEESARSYLKSIFSKTETHRQGQLVALLATMGLLSNDKSVDFL
ncbi:helix-turn-helix transcriptional regulator [Mesorhizobium sp. ISC11]|uniref:helix-turn-helix transcriptional regulator n=1 Tax=Mesorhizobium sp. ISC11 TaxID=3076428 RepID=UPI00301DF11C